MKTRFKFLVILLAFTLIFAGTSTTSQAITDIDEVDDVELRIGFVSHQHDITDLFGQLEVGFRNRLDIVEGLEYDLYQANPTASYRHDEMLDILETQAEMNLDYLVMGPTSLERNEPGLIDVADAGTHIVMTDYEPDPDYDYPYKDQVLSWVIYDHYEMGYETGVWLADYYRDMGNYEPNVIMLWGPADSEISIDRGTGVLDGLEDAEDINANVIYEAHANFERELSYTQAENSLIAYPDVDVFVGMNSETAMGAMAAVEAAGAEDDVMVVGMGGQVDELGMVYQDRIGVAVLRDPRDMGRMAAESILLHYMGREDEIPEIQFTDLIPIDSAEAVEEYVPEGMREAVYEHVPEDMILDN